MTDTYAGPATRPSLGHQVSGFTHTAILARNPSVVRMWDVAKHLAYGVTWNAMSAAVTRGAQWLRPWCEKNSIPLFLDGKLCTCNECTIYVLGPPDTLHGIDNLSLWVGEHGRAKNENGNVWKKGLRRKEWNRVNIYLRSEWHMDHICEFYTQF